MKDRFAAIRTQLGLSQEEFGRRIGVSRFSISNYEAGARNITDRVAADVCREFKINYRWLTTGEGEMFLECDNDVSQLIDRVMSGENEFAKSIFKSFARFDTEDWKKLQEIVQKLSEGFSVDSVSKLIQQDAEYSQEIDIEQEVAAYRLELEAEQKGKTSSVSDDIKDA